LNLGGRAKTASGLAKARSRPKRPHPVLHLDRNAIFAHDRSLVAQSDRLALDDKAPQGVACLPQQALADGACRRLLGEVAGIGAQPIVLRQRRERRLARAAQPAQRSRLLLRDLVVERLSRTLLEFIRGGRHAGFPRA
jgi:hypothetical protein